MPIFFARSSATTLSILWLELTVNAFDPRKLLCSCPENKQMGESELIRQLTAPKQNMPLQQPRCYHTCRCLTHSPGPHQRGAILPREVAISI